MTGLARMAIDQPWGCVALTLFAVVALLLVGRVINGSWWS